MMNYGIAIFPSKSIQDEANSYRKRYDTAYELIPPHVTVKESFEADEDTLQQTITALKKVANDIKPFTLNINKVSTFAPVTNTIYFKIEPVQELLDLNEKLNSGEFDDNRTHPYVPHMTVAQDLVEDEYSDVFGSMKMKKIQFEEQVDRFQLLYQLDNGSWTVYETFVFGKEQV